MREPSILLSELNIASVIIRLVLASVIGGMIGMEREKKGRAAGFRTYMFVALGATAAMMINQYLDVMQRGPWNNIVEYTARTDASRLGAQVINGVGFLGSGTILVTQRQGINGITTAAGLWASACLGLAVGAGFYECAIVGVLIILICMITFSNMETRIMSNAKNMNVYMELAGYENVGFVTAAVKAMGIRVFSVDVNKSSSEIGCSAVFNLQLPNKELHQKVLARLSAIDGIKFISEV